MRMTEQDRERLSAWLAGGLPDEWFTAPPVVTVDREEAVVVGSLPDVELGADATDAARETAREARISRWREETRERRMAIADDIEQRFGRKVAWGVEIGGVRRIFTNLAVPVMTRLRQDDRLVLDTLVDAGVARSRSEALAWCVRLVGRNEAAWITQLREAMESVARVRDEGPGA
ncbi:MAG: hypothetical protein WCH74_08255 [Chloroflexota bacterium]